jgi:hypothetical protein
MEKTKITDFESKSSSVYLDLDLGWSTDSEHCDLRLNRVLDSELGFAGVRERWVELGFDEWKLRRERGELKKLKRVWEIEIGEFWRRRWWWSFARVWKIAQIREGQSLVSVSILV